MPLQVFTNVEFRGHYPAGVAAVVVAANREAAAQLLEADLAVRGLAQTVPAMDMHQLPLHEPCIWILRDGDY